MTFYETDNLKLTVVTIGGKRELVIDYYRAGMLLESLITEDLENPNRVTIKLNG